MPTTVFEKLLEEDFLFRMVDLHDGQSFGLELYYIVEKQWLIYQAPLDLRSDQPLTPELLRDVFDYVGETLRPNLDGLLLLAWSLALAASEE